MAKHDRQANIRARRAENCAARRLMRRQARALRWELLRAKFRISGKGSRKKVTTPQR
jgi:hypothetical protein